MLRGIYLSLTDKDMKNMGLCTFARSIGFAFPLRYATQCHWMAIEAFAHTVIKVREKRVCANLEQATWCFLSKHQS